MAPEEGAPESKHVLVVDDDENFRRSLEEVFKKEGFQVHSAYDGTTIAVAIRERRPDVIVTDLLIPGVGGLELIRNLLMPEFDSVPVIVMTARQLNDEAKAQMMQQVYIAEIVQKPPSLPAVVQLLHRELKTKRKSADDTTKGLFDKRATIDEQRNMLGVALSGSPKVRLGLNVLIVDDSETQRLQIRLLLEKEGCGCSEAGDGKHALEVLKSFQADAIILDINMPNLDGMSLLRQMQADPDLGSIPIIIMTAKIMNAATRTEIEMESNVRRVLQKPLDNNLLRELLAQIAKKKGEGN